MDQAKQDGLKKAAAKKAAALVEDGMVLGVGTGSTVKFFIDELGKKKAAGLTLKAVVTTSVSPLSEVDQVDLTVDGADRVDKQLNGIKGGGAALTLEKNVAVNSKKNVWIVDESKVVDHLSGFALPVEVLPISCMQVEKRLADEGLKPEFRLTEDGQRLKTHYGNCILDLKLDRIPVPSGLADYLDHTVGVVEHGLFLNICDQVIIARDNGEIEVRSR